MPVCPTWWLYGIHPSSTAALDAQAEYDVYSRFVELMAGKTSLLISHRFSTVRMADVIAVLEELEDGLLGDLYAIDPYMCTGGCFGSPLLAEDHHVAAYRWAQGRAVLAPDTLRAGAADSPLATPRKRPFAARPGLRLDPDMGRAIEKLGRLQAIIDSLPGKDCGTCGAPTCAALAEDVVTERAGIDLCPYVKPGMKEDRDR